MNAMMRSREVGQNILLIFIPRIIQLTGQLRLGFWCSIDRGLAGISNLIRIEELLIGAFSHERSINRQFSIES